MAALPNEILLQIFGHCVSSPTPSDYFSLRQVSRVIHDIVTAQFLRPALSTVVVRGRHFRRCFLPEDRRERIINNRTLQAVEHLTVELGFAGTIEEREAQLDAYASMLEGFLENGRNIRSVDVFFDEDWAAHMAKSHDFSSIVGDDEWYNHFPWMGHKPRDLILDRTVAVAERFAKADGGHSIRVDFSSPHMMPTSDEHTDGLLTCAGRNTHTVVVRNRLDSSGREEWALESAAAGDVSPDGAPSNAPGRLGKSTRHITIQVSNAIKHLLDRYLTTPPPGLDPNYWAIFAEHLARRRHLLLGVNTSSTSDLNVPDAARGDFETAIRGLEEAAGILREAPVHSGTHPAAASLSRAYTALEIMCDAERARLASEKGLAYPSEEADEAEWDGWVAEDGPEDWFAQDEPEDEDSPFVVRTD